MSNLITDPEGLNKMRIACQEASSVLDFITPYIQPGVTTVGLDRLCLDYINNTLGANSATVGYAPTGSPPFPSSICYPVHHVLCHGITGTTVLTLGELVHIDVTNHRQAYVWGKGVTVEVGT